MKAIAVEDARFEGLRWIEDRSPHAPSVNMAVDEVLLSWVAGLGVPVLRTYRWEGPSRSIGYFTPRESQETYLAGGGRLVRRLTGGGVVDHGEDFTYTLVLPTDHPLAGLPGGDRYRMIHERVAAALRATGIDCDLVPIDASGAVAGKACFAHPVGWDVVDPAGRKLAGAGQRRRRDGLLHQGSILAEGVGEGFGEVLARHLGFEGAPEDLPGDVLREAERVAERYLLS